MPAIPGPLLAGKVAVVTGGGGGIGRAVSETFAAHGAAVVVADVDEGRAAETVAAIEANGGLARAHVVDVTEPDQVRALVDAAGEIEVLVNNVGHYLHRSHDFVDSTRDEWEALYRVNLRHVFLCCHAIVPGMIDRRRGGAIVNVSSVEAFRGIPQHAVYAAFKGGVTQFTKSLALELGAHGIRVNAVAPDLTETIQVPYGRWVREEDRALIPQWVPAGRFGTPDDIAATVLFLASDLSAFVTGTTVHADGGSLAAGGWFRTRVGSWTNRPGGL